MAFKSVEQFNDDRYHNMFRITDDGGSEDVVFLYRSKADMLVADVHYVRSNDYSGYVHCIGSGCPACKKGIRTQTKVFIPVYNISKGAIEFWDKTMAFEPQMNRDVFSKFPNPSEYVFRITRHGAYRDVNTHYDIVAVGKNSTMSYEQILAKCNATMPDYYETIVRSVSLAELTGMLQSSVTDNSASIPDYVPVPRAGYQSSIPDTYVNTAEVVNFNTSAPEVDSVEGVADPEGDDEFPTPNF